MLSPEYVYQIRPGDIMPDAKRFGVLWMNEADLAAAFDMEGPQRSHISSYAGHLGSGGDSPSLIA